MGTSLIIKGADFSSVAVEQKFRTLYWDKNKDNNYVPYNGEQQSSTDGIYLNTASNVAHHIYAALTDFIDIEGYKKLYVNSVFNLGNSKAVCFFNSSYTLEKSYNSTSLDGYDTLKEHTFDIPAAVKYVRIGFYGDSQSVMNRYNEFYAVASMV